MSGSEQFIDDKRAREQLLESEVNDQAMAEAATVAIITINSESTILLVNPAAEKIFGHSIEEMLGQPLTLLMPEYLRHDRAGQRCCAKGFHQKIETCSGYHTANDLAVLTQIHALSTTSRRLLAGNHS